MHPHTTSPAAEPSVEEYNLPCVEALLAGCFALMTGYAQSAPDCPHRPVLAAKLIFNLIRLSNDGALTPPMRAMLANLRMRWQLELDRHLSASRPPPPAPLWCAPSSTVQ